MLKVAQGNSKKLSGFTIVELLIVIIVIAILAAVTIVAYNGVTKTAENNKMLAQVQTWEKFIRSYRSQFGSFPTATYEYTCLGRASDFPAQGVFLANECMHAAGWAISAQDSLMTQFAQTGIAIPGGYNGQTHALADGSYRGILYLSRNGGVGLTYTLRGTNSSCIPGDTTYNNGGFTVCRKVIEGDPFNGL